MDTSPLAASTGSQSRSRITVVCAECKRLKLKCDRRTPCGSCTKRDTVARCVYSPAAAEKVSLTPAELMTGEIFWRDHQIWLQDSGYMLRPRYMPNWTPAWNKTNKPYFDFEDSIWLPHSQLIDATRISDGAPVGLKKVSKSVHPYEAGIAEFFSSEQLSMEPRNHCVPILQILGVPDDPDLIIIVMPLFRVYDSPRFDTVGEAIECIRQFFEGLHFMHQHHVAHRDCNRRNFMMDPRLLYPDGYHPLSIKSTRNYKGTAQHFTRTQRPPKYYLIDFGISRKYNPADGPPLEDPILGGDKTVPEYNRSDAACDPFPVDVYYAGNVIRRDFLDGDDINQPGKYGFEFLRPLVSDMVQDDPSKRPTMDEVVSRFETIRKGLSNWKLRSPVVLRTDFAFPIHRIVAHWIRRLVFILKRVPPIPVPN